VSERPEPVRLDDLAEPRFSEEIQPVLSMMGEAADGLELAPEPLMEAAVSRTGLDDFGPEDFVERLDVLCEALRTEAHLSPRGMMAQHAMLTGLLCNRLLVEDTIKRQPDVLDEEIRSPIIISGLPRTGTTHLHNLISADPALRSLPYWESLEPVLPQSERPGSGQADPRLARTEESLAFLDAAMPYFKRMHEMTVDHVHEEIQLLAIDFSTMLFETVAPMPTWRDYYLEHDQRSNYQYLKKVLQVLQRQRGGDRWVLKSPQHIEQFPTLSETFPDAIFVVTHRDPVTVSASMATMLTYSARMTHDQVDVRWVARYWADRLQRMFRSCVDQREVLSPEQSVDVHFDKFMADDLGMIERIYEIADQPFSASVGAAMEGYMAAHPRGRLGAVLYDLGELGLDHDELRRALGFYTARFEVAEED
jgi:hypothetical protein